MLDDGRAEAARQGGIERIGHLGLLVALCTTGEQSLRFRAGRMCAKDPFAKGSSAFTGGASPYDMLSGSCPSRGRINGEIA